MTATNQNAKVWKIKHRTKNGKKFIVINQACWYPSDSWTDETAAADYIFTHSNNGFNFISRFAE